MAPCRIKSNIAVFIIIEQHYNKIAVLKCVHSYGHFSSIRSVVRISHFPYGFRSARWRSGAYWNHHRWLWVCRLNWHSTPAIGSGFSVCVFGVCGDHRIIYHGRRKSVGGYQPNPVLWLCRLNSSMAFVTWSTYAISRVFRYNFTTDVWQRKWSIYLMISFWRLQKRIYLRISWTCTDDGANWGERRRTGANERKLMAVALVGVFVVQFIACVTHIAIELYPLIIE